MVKIFKNSVSILTFVCALSPVSAMASSKEIQWFPYPNTGVSLGQGFDLLTGQPTPASCIDFKTNYDRGLDTSISFTEINSFVDTMSSMKISGSGKLKLALYEASANLSLANESKVTRSFKDVGVNARVFLGASYVSPTKDTKYRPNNNNLKDEGETRETREQAKPAITFTDMALNEWRGLSNATTSDKVSAYTICGSGYVSTIISGVELNAILSSEDSKYDDSAKFSGDLKAKILGGLATIQASATGESQSKKEFKSIKVNARITGKDDYQIPLNGDTLQTFIRDLPKKFDAKTARPILIAVTPYGNLFPAVAGAYTTASDFSVLVDAWFIAREARARILETIKNYGNRNVSAKSHFLEKSHMHKLVEDAYVLEAKIQNELRTLVSEAQVANNASDKGEDKTPWTIFGETPWTVFDDMVAAKKARDSRRSEEIKLLQTNILRKLKEVPGKSNNGDNDNKDAGLLALDRKNDLSRKATDLYLAALLSVGGKEIDLDYLLTEDEKHSFKLALHFLIKGAEEEIEGLSEENFAKVAKLLQEKEQCIGEAAREYLDTRRDRAVHDGTSIYEDIAQQIRQAYDDEIKICRISYNQRFADVVGNSDAGDLKSADADQDVRYISQSLFIDVVARYVYEDRFLPIKISACDSDPKSSFCSIDSDTVRYVVNDLIVADKKYVTARAQPLFGFTFTGTVPNDKLKEIKRPPQRPIPHICRDTINNRKRRLDRIAIQLDGIPMQIHCPR